MVVPAVVTRRLPPSASVPVLVRTGEEAAKLAQGAAEESEGSATGGGEVEKVHRSSEVARLRVVRSALRFASTASLIHGSAAQLEALNESEAVARASARQSEEQQRAAVAARAEGRLAAARAQAKPKPAVVGFRLSDGFFVQAVQ